MSQLQTRGLADLAVTNDKIANTTITNAKISASAAILLSKLEAVTDGNILIGNGSNVLAQVTPSGDVTLSNAGEFAIASGAIVNDDINASAGIALSKLAALTINKALVSDGSGVISASATTSTEIGYLSGVSSNIQTQLDALSSGYSRRKAVKDYIVDNTAAPPTEVSGDRYILSHDGGSPHADWDGASAGDIVEFNGTSWVATTPLEGYIAYDDDSNYDYLYVNDGTGQWEQRVVLTTSLADGKIWVGNGSNVAAAVTPSGDVTIDNAGVFTIGSTKVTNDMLAGSIADSKLSQITTADKVAGSAVQLNAEGSISNDTGLKALKYTVENLTLDATDISNGYVDLAQTPFGAKVTMSVAGLPPQLLGTDYTVSSNRVTFAGDLASGGAAALINGDKVQVEYSYL